MNVSNSKSLATGQTQIDSVKTSQNQGENKVWQGLQAKYGAKPKKQREIKKSLDKDDFMRIMIEQMKHQDPTKPFETDKLAAEIAQITSVEQLSNVNKVLDKLSTQNRPLEQMTMTNLIGKTVTIDQGKFAHKSDSRESLNFTLNQDAKKVKATIIGMNGELVAEADLGELKAGSNKFNWDGLNKSRLPQKAGDFLLRIEAFDEKDRRIDTSTVSNAKVIGVSYDGPEPVYLVGDANHQSRIQMKNIISILDINPEQIKRDAPKSGKSFFTFEKGVGSKPLSKKQEKVINDLIHSKNENQNNKNTNLKLNKVNNVESGFPNGLKEFNLEKIPNANLNKNIKRSSNG